MTKSLRHKILVRGVGSKSMLEEYVKDTYYTRFGTPAITASEIYTPMLDST